MEGATTVDVNILIHRVFFFFLPSFYYWQCNMCLKTSSGFWYSLLLNGQYRLKNIHEKKRENLNWTCHHSWFSFFFMMCLLTNPFEQNVSETISNSTLCIFWNQKKICRLISSYMHVIPFLAVPILLPFLTQISW